MAIQVEDFSYEKHDGKLEQYPLSNWLVTNTADLANIPKVAPGSMAWTADMTSMWQYNGTQWKKIGGDS